MLYHSSLTGKQSDFDKRCLYLDDNIWRGLYICIHVGKIQYNKINCSPKWLLIIYYSRFSFQLGWMCFLVKRGQCNMRSRVTHQGLFSCTTSFKNPEPHFYCEFGSVYLVFLKYTKNLWRICWEEGGTGRTHCEVYTIYKTSRFRMVQDISYFLFWWMNEQDLHAVPNSNFLVGSTIISLTLVGYDQGWLSANSVLNVPHWRSIIISYPIARLW